MLVLYRLSCRAWVYARITLTTPVKCPVWNACFMSRYIIPIKTDECQRSCIHMLNAATFYAAVECKKFF